MEGGHIGGKVIKRSRPPSLNSPIVMARNIRENKQLLFHFVSRDMKLKYHGSVLGYGWTIIEPLVMTGVFYLLFAILTTISRLSRRVNASNDTMPAMNNSRGK